MVSFVPIAKSHPISKSGQISGMSAEILLQKLQKITQRQNRDYTALQTCRIGPVDDVCLGLLWGSD